MVDLTLSLAPGTYGAENHEGPGVTVSKRHGLHILHLAGDLSDTDFPTAARHSRPIPGVSTPGPYSAPGRVTSGQLRSDRHLRRSPLRSGVERCKL